MKMRETVLGIILLLSVACAASSETINNKPVEPAIEPPEGPHYVCPKNEYVDCMPPIGEEKRAVCSKEYRRWAKSNCPGVKFVY